MQLQSLPLIKQGFKALKGHWQWALLAVFTANILYTIASIAGSLVTRQALVELTTLAEQGYSAQAIIQSESYSALFSLFGFTFLAAIFSVGFRMGLARYFTMLIRKEEPGFTVIFSRMGSFFKMLGVQLYTFLMAFVITMLLMLVLFGLFFFAGSMTMAAAQVLIYLYILFAAIVLVAFCMRYAMAEYLLAQDETLRPMAAIRKSKALMRGHLKPYLGLSLGYYLLSFTITYGASFLIALLGSFIGSVVHLFLSLMVSTAAAAGFAAFYVARISKNENENQDKIMV